MHPVAGSFSFSVDLHDMLSYHYDALSYGSLDIRMTKGTADETTCTG